MERSESNVLKQTYDGYESIAFIPRPVHSEIPKPLSVSSARKHNVTTPLRKVMEEKRRKNTKKSSKYSMNKTKPQTTDTDWRIPPSASVNDMSYGTYITYNGHPIDLDPMKSYIQIFLQNRRRMENQRRRIDEKWVEIQNGVYKSELVEYPPDFLKNKLLKLLAIKDAKENKNQHHGQTFLESTTHTANIE